MVASVLPCFQFYIFIWSNGTLSLTMTLMSRVVTRWLDVALWNTKEVSADEISCSKNYFLKCIVSQKDYSIMYSKIYLTLSFYVRVLEYKCVQSDRCRNCRDGETWQVVIKWDGICSVGGGGNLPLASHFHPLHRRPYYPRVSSHFPLMNYIRSPPPPAVWLQYIKWSEPTRVCVIR